MAEHKRIRPLLYLALLAFHLMAPPSKANTDTAMSPNMKDILERGVQLRTEPRSGIPSGIVTTIIDKTQGRILGSGTRLCGSQFAGADPSKSYILTNYHVIADSISRLETLGAKAPTLEEKIDLAFYDSGFDTALFTTSAGTTAPCAALAVALRVPTVFDADSAGNTARRYLTIEAYDTERKKITLTQLETVIGSAVYPGIPGYDSVPDPLLLNARSLRGMSGGAVFSEVVNGQLNGPDRHLRTKAPTLLIGLIQGVDLEGRRTTAIPSPALFQRIQKYVSNPKRYGSKRASILEGASIYYPDLQARYFRGSPIQQRRSGLRTESGLALTAPAGTARGGDGGTARGGDGGTARGGDGGGKSLSSTPASGLVFEDQPGRIWLSLFELWAEYESLTPVIRSSIKKHGRVGVYQEDNAYFISHANASIPAFLLNDVLLNDPEYDLSPEKLWEAARNQPFYENCRRFVALIRRSGVEVSVGSVIFHCDSQTAQGRSMTLSIFPMKMDVPSLTLEVNVLKNCSTNQKLCPLSVNGSLIRHTNPSPAKPNENPYLWYGNWLQSIQRLPKESLHPQGLRYWTAPGIEVLFERLGGFRINLNVLNTSWTYTGPTGDAVTKTSPVLSEPSHMEEYMEYIFKLSPMK